MRLQRNPLNIDEVLSCGANWSPPLSHRHAYDFLEYFAEVGWILIGFQRKQWEPALRLWHERLRRVDAVDLALSANP